MSSTGLAALDAGPRCMLDDGARRVCELGIRLPDVVFCGIRLASKEHNYVARASWKLGSSALLQPKAFIFPTTQCTTLLRYSWKHERPGVQTACCMSMRAGRAWSARAHSSKSVKTVLGLQRHFVRKLRPRMLFAPYTTASFCPVPIWLYVTPLQDAQVRGRLVAQDAGPAVGKHACRRYNREVSKHDSALGSSCSIHACCLSVPGTRLI